jgi:hypothetical protein
VFLAARQVASRPIANFVANLLSAIRNALIWSSVKVLDTNCRQVAHPELLSRLHTTMTSENPQCSVDQHRHEKTERFKASRNS